MVLAVQLFQQDKWKKKKTNNLKNLFRCISWMLCRNKCIFLLIYSFLYVLDIDVTRNENNLKLKVKSEFSLSMGLI